MASVKHPLKIERGIPMPEGNRQFHGKMAEARAELASMDVGDSFIISRDCDRKRFYEAALEIRATITTRRNGTGYRVWLRTKAKP